MRLRRELGECRGARSRWAEIDGCGGNILRLRGGRDGPGLGRDRGVRLSVHSAPNYAPVKLSHQGGRIAKLPRARIRSGEISPWRHNLRVVSFCCVVSLFCFVCFGFILVSDVFCRDYYRMLSREYSIAAIDVDSAENGLTTVGGGTLREKEPFF